MKHQLVFLICCIFLCANSTQAQDKVTKTYRNVVVWEFVGEDEEGKLARDIRAAVQEILAEISPEMMVGRDRLGTLTSIIHQENQIESLKQASKTAKTALKTARAEYVLFGSVKRDDVSSGAVRIRLEVDELATTYVINFKSLVLGLGQTAPADLKNNIRPLVYETFRMELPDEYKPQKDTHWDNALKKNTIQAMEEYLNTCPSCEHESDARKFISDERSWETINEKMSDKRRVNLLREYLRLGNKRHMTQAQTWRKNMLDDARRKDKTEWIIAGSCVLVGLGTGFAGIQMENKAQDKYLVYENNLDPGDKMVYGDLSRDEYLNQANSKHVAAQWLKGIGIGAMGIAAFFVSKRLAWRKTLKRGDELVIHTGILPAPGLMVGAENFGLLLNLRF